MRRFALTLALCSAIFPVAAAAQGAPTADEIRILVSRLDAEDPENREAAARALERIGPPALPALHQASASGSPEARAAAAGLVRRITLSAVLDKPECAALKSIWRTLEQGTPDEKDLAFDNFFRPAGLPAALPDRLMEILQQDPENPAGTAAAEVLAWLASPGTAHRLVHPEPGGGDYFSPPADNMEWLERTFSMERKSVEFSPAALKIFMEADRSTFNRDCDGVSDLEQVRAICASLGLRFRLAPTPPVLRFEVPAEFLPGCRSWWKDLCAAPGGASRLEWSAPPPMAGTLDAEWLSLIRLLDSEDAEASAAARRIVANAPAPVAEGIWKQASGPSAGPALQDAAERLRLRSRGRIAGVVERRKCSWLCVMDLGGGAIRDLWGPFECSGGPVAFGEDAVVIFRDCDGDAGYYQEFWEIRLSGEPRPRLLADHMDFVVPRRQGRWLAGWDTPGGIALVDADSGEKTQIDSTLECQPPSWNPDGSVLAWSRKNASVCLWSAATGKVSVLEGPGGWIREWSPDGTAFLLQRPADPENSETGWGRTVFLEVVEVSGKRHSISGPHTGMMDARWSPDGKRVACCFQDPYKVETPFKLEITSREGGAPLCVTDSTFCGKDQNGRVEWEAGQGHLRFFAGGSPCVLVDPATGKISPAVPDPTWDGIAIPGTEWFLSAESGAPQLVRADGHRLTLSSIPLDDPLVLPAGKSR